MSFKTKKVIFSVLNVNLSEKSESKLENCLKLESSLKHSQPENTFSTRKTVSFELGPTEPAKVLGKLEN